MAPHPLPHATILNYLTSNDKQEGVTIFCRILAPPMPPLPRRHST